MLSIEEIRTSLNERSHEPAKFTATPSHAAVAMILCPGDEELEACFIRRAERDGDPWSGQVAFPGGRASAGDTDAYATAERETWEEIGMQLRPEHRLGPLPIRPINRHGNNGELTLSPFIYYVGATQRAQAKARLPDEVASVFWVPLSHLFDEDAVTELEYPLGGNTTTFPGISFGEHVIWGLTLRVLESFANIMRRSMPALS